MIIQKSMKRLKTFSHRISNSPEKTFRIAFDLASEISKSCLIGLTGEMGVGKTVFAKGFAEGLGIKELITSPTFLGISESYSGRFPFVHMDFYKKVVPKNLIEHFQKSKCIVLIEWINNFETVFKEKLNVDISVLIQYLRNKEGLILENEREIIVL
ncbi:MAG: tRNA (adenosine(37)-N6)-threonylcarbamoyltransferase complex ATPase subunit type 1 TsaE [Candidatus Melainabacteria bacterium RIFCSPLOWO2_02_FULL_35_15]|nr:MAG: tRNA (adenosine(37)-N6)-threonylcarbamoyltransferase complex ATPase subunit type 1 TsaE [Candidatus Melainabacteria bacterium RIFCSPLOWO2_12_FULL_35_11]OGI13508.1 MAG: tRNA (adenosine(37)-N6)-threonylcarbamoyltransferase complex ATPase subunit type 1 TsaE [Candidatus Melainabacteria bacterium RIFCSPLOWO2_02_FULL_35_15]